MKNKEENTLSISCKICGEVFYHYFPGREKKLLSKHLKLLHNITTYDYVLRYYYNGVVPKCLCGCGNETKYKKWKFDKYFLDHKNKMSVPKDIRKKISASLFEKSGELYKKLGLTKSQLEEYWHLYKTPEYNQKEIRKYSGVDFRTLKRYWILLNIVDKMEIERYSRKHQSQYSNVGEKNGSFTKIDHNLLNTIVEYAGRKNYNGTPIYMYEVINKFNLCVSKHVLTKRLTERFGEECLKIFRNNSLSSEEEIEFGFILKYFFGNSNISAGFRIENRVYDFLICGKILLEFDGDYWHCRCEDNHPLGDEYVKNKIKVDREKDELAHKNGYPLFRVWSSNNKNFDVILTLFRDIKKELEK
jgi:hypothetical protein